MATSSISHSGSSSPIPIAIGMAPRSSISGTIETKKTKSSLRIISIRCYFLSKKSVRREMS